MDFEFRHSDTAAYLRAEDLLSVLLSISAVQWWDSRQYKYRAFFKQTDSLL